MGEVRGALGFDVETYWITCNGVVDVIVFLGQDMAF